MNSNSTINSSGVLILGAGIVGLTLARELALRGVKDIVILEKETELGRHASGRNSGVLHAGIYYSTDSLKAKFCAQGSRMMQEYATENGIRVEKTGKVIVAQEESLVSQLELIFQRATSSGIPVRKINRQELHEIEPEAKSVAHALFSPETAVIDSKSVLTTLARELDQLKVRLCLGAAALSIDSGKRTVQTPQGTWHYGTLVNCAGLYADRLAHQMGVGRQYRILPFKGLYRKIKGPVATRIRGSIYPAPDLRFPFLGVHLTRNIEGEILAGPTAIPALGRENYHFFSNLSLRDTPKMLSQLGSMFWNDTDRFRALLKEETLKLTHRGFLGNLQKLAPALAPEHLSRDYAKIGIRAQLMDTKQIKLVMDFVVEGGEHSLHVLNAISPAFTCSFAFAKFLADRLERENQVV